MNNRLAASTLQWLNARSGNRAPALIALQNGSARVRNRALGWTLVAALLLPLGLAVALGPLYAEAARGSAVWQLAIHVALLGFMVAVGSVAYGALLHAFSRWEAAQAARPPG